MKEKILKALESLVDQELGGTPPNERTQEQEFIARTEVSDALGLAMAQFRRELEQKYGLTLVGMLAEVGVSKIRDGWQFCEVNYIADSVFDAISMMARDHAGTDTEEQLKELSDKLESEFPELIEDPDDEDDNEDDDYGDPEEEEPNPCDDFGKKLVFED